jgi:centrin-3
MIASLDSLGEEPQKQTLYVMLKQNAENGQSHLDFYEFLEVMSNRISSKDNRTDLKKVFAMLDEDNRGFISIDTLKKVAKDLGDNIDEC